VKALVVRRPWAELIGSGAKDVENRGRRTSHRGQLLIVAGKGWDPGGVEYAARIGVDIPPDPDAYPTGALAVVDLTGVCSASADLQAPRAASGGCTCSLWGQLGQHHWRLANVRRLTEPIPMPRVMPGLFTPPPAVAAAVLARLETETIGR
jgi:hypothetical protein